MKFRDFSHWKKKLRDMSRTYAVLVEGKRDLQALRRMGVSNIIPLAGKRVAEIPDLLEGKFEGAILLYDLDAHGERINRKVKELLSSQGFHTFEDFREFLRTEGIIHIEELSGKRHG